MAVVLSHPNPKCKISQFLQTHLKKNLAKEDIVYDTQKVDGKYVTTATINCLGGEAAGEQFVGDFSHSKKDAERSVAEKILQHHKETIDALTPSNVTLSRAPKRKRDGDDAGDLAEVAAPQLVPKSDGDDAGDVPETTAPPVVSKPALAKPAPVAVPSSCGETNSNKEALNAICMKIMKKGDVLKGYASYDTQEIESGGYQSSCRIACIPGKYESTYFTGEVCKGKKDAEQSAAGYAVEALMKDPEVVTMARLHETSRGKGKGKKGGGKDSYEFLWEQMTQMMQTISWMKGKGIGKGKKGGGKDFPMDPMMM